MSGTPAVGCAADVADSPLPRRRLSDFMLRSCVTLQAHHQALYNQTDINSNGPSNTTTITTCRTKATTTKAKASTTSEATILTSPQRRQGINSSNNHRNSNNHSIMRPPLDSNNNTAAMHHLPARHQVSNPVVQRLSRNPISFLSRSAASSAKQCSNSR